MFLKLNADLGDVDFERLKGSVVISYGRLTYFTVKDEEYLKNLVPADMFKNMVPPLSVQLAEIIGSGHLAPHRDHNISACANYYLETNNSTTYFYKEKNGSQPRAFPGKKIANIYSFDQVEKVGEFVANDKDLYLLDVSQIHSVETKTFGIRRFITWQWCGIPYANIVANA